MASSVWKGHLTFGLVSFPVRLFSAARGETISFNLLHKQDHSRIKQVIYCQAEDKPVPRSELVKGYEYEKDHYVEVDEEDIKKVAPKTAKVMEVLEFVKADEVDPIYLESSYYMAPEIRQVDEFSTDTSQVKEKELALAKMLIDSLTAEFEPQKYQDTYRTNLQAMIQAKLEGQQVVATPTPHIAPVIDIMEALKRSLAEQKKPVASATAAVAEADAEEVAGQPAAKKRRRSQGGR